ncbi:MAG: hypothetical protein AB7T49_00200 [Oligoflexales bacterium]
MDKSGLPKQVFLCLAVALTLAGGVATVANFYMGIATGAYTLMVSGLIFRRRPKIHSKFMATAISLDLGVLVTLEIQRHAIDTALSFSLSPIQQMHVATSSVATILYFPILFLGWKQLYRKATARGRLLHMRLGIAAFVFRTFGFLLMFSLLGQETV